MATALSSKAWYSWCSPYLIDVSKKPKDKNCLEKDDMINIGHPLLVVGHNVSYDRARIAEQYDLGDFQLLDLIITVLKSHMTWSGFTCYGFFLSNSNIKSTDRKYPLD